jgi:hypothetical protein
VLGNISSRRSVRSEHVDSSTGGSVGSGSNCLSSIDAPHATLATIRATVSGLRSGMSGIVPDGLGVGKKDGFVAPDLTSRRLL